mgnify:CR=1 FL=1
MQSQSSNSNKRKKGAQQTLFGAVAFDPAKSCAKCRGGKTSHKGHHPKCWNNPRKRAQSKAMLQEEKRLKELFEAPLTEAEKCSGQHMTPEATATFFAPREGALKLAAVPATKMTALTNPNQSTATANTSVVTADSMCTDVTALVNDAKFVEQHKTSAAPLAMLAFAKVVVERIVLDKQIDVRSHFDGLSMTAPSNNKLMEPPFALR